MSHISANGRLGIARLLAQVLKERDAADETENDGVAAGRGKEAARCRTDDCGVPAYLHEEVELLARLLPSSPLPVYEFNGDFGSSKDLLAPT